MQQFGTVKFRNLYVPDEEFEINISSIAKDKYWEIGTANILNVTKFSNLDDAELYKELLD